ncbi:MAG: thioredoxin family protein [Sulfurovum sp.]
MIWTGALLSLFASEGAELFDKHCASCHSDYQPMSRVIANAEQNNTLLHLKAPTLNQLSFGVRLNVGDRKADEESQRMEVEEFIASYIAAPQREQSVLPQALTHFYPDMPSMQNLLDEEQIEALSSFIFEYGEEMIKAHSAKVYTFEEAVKVAKEQKKIIMIRGVLPYCKWCIKMDREVMVEPEVRKVLDNSFVVVKTNVVTEKLPLGMVSLGTPSFYCIKSDGETILDQLNGYGNKEEFLALLEKIKKAAKE